MQADYRVIGFASPYVVVVRRSDGASGALEFASEDDTRWYFGFDAGVFRVVKVAEAVLARDLGYFKTPVSRLKEAVSGPQADAGAGLNQYPNSSDAPQLGCQVTAPGWLACQRARTSSRPAVLRLAIANELPGV